MVFGASMVCRVGVCGSLPWQCRGPRSGESLGNPWPALEYLPGKDAGLLMDGVNKPKNAKVDSRTELDTENLISNQFERRQSWLKGDLWWRMFITEYDNGLSLGESRLQQLQAVANAACVTRI